MKCAEHVAGMEETIWTYRGLEEKLERKNHLKDLGLDGRIMLKWILKKWNGRHGLD